MEYLKWIVEDGLLPTVIALVGVYVTRQTNRRDHIRHAVEATHTLTTGEVAEARDAIGHLVHTNGSRTLGKNDIQHYFTVLWAFDRVFSVYATLRWSPVARRALLTGAHAAIKTWEDYVFPEDSESPLEGPGMTDENSIKGLAGMVAAHRIEPPFKKTWPVLRHLKGLWTSFWLPGKLDTHRRELMRRRCKPVAGKPVAVKP